MKGLISLWSSSCKNSTITSKEKNPMDICLFQVNDKDDREESIDIILVSLFLTLSKYLPIEVKLK